MERIFVDNDDEIRVVFYKLNMYNYAYPQEEKECMNMKHLTTKKILALGLGAAMSLSLFTGCGGRSGETKAPSSQSSAPGEKEAADYGGMTIDELKPLLQTVNEGKLTMVTSPDFAPAEFYVIGDDGTPTLAGMDIALAGYIAGYLGLELEIVPIDFDGVLMEIQNKAADIALAGLAADPKRTGIMDFTVPYEVDPESNQCFICLEEDKDNFPSLEATSDPQYQIGAQIGSIQSDFADQFSPNAEIIRLGKVTDIINELLAGKLDGAYMSMDTAEAYHSTYPQIAIVLDVPNDFAGTCAGVVKDNPALLAAVNLAIESAVDQGLVAQYKEKAMEQATGNIYEGLLDAQGNTQE